MYRTLDARDVASMIPFAKNGDFVITEQNHKRNAGKSGIAPTTSTTHNASVLEPLY
jgi:hypothetical protein